MLRGEQATKLRLALSAAATVKVVISRSGHRLHGKVQGDREGWKEAQERTFKIKP
jgi:hypothetical protein